MVPVKFNISLGLRKKLSTILQVIEEEETRTNTILKSTVKCMSVYISTTGTKYGILLSFEIF